jgi:hypothetical protein
MSLADCPLKLMNRATAQTERGGGGINLHSDGKVSSAGPNRDCSAASFEHFGLLVYSKCTQNTATGRSQVDSCCRSVSTIVGQILLSNGHCSPKASYHQLYEISCKLSGLTAGLPSWTGILPSLARAWGGA